MCSWWWLSRTKVWKTVNIISFIYQVRKSLLFYADSHRWPVMSSAANDACEIRWGSKVVFPHREHLLTIWDGCTFPGLCLGTVVLLPPCQCDVECLLDSYHVASCPGLCIGVFLCVICRECPWAEFTLRCVVCAGIKPISCKLAHSHFARMCVFVCVYGWYGHILSKILSQFVCSMLSAFSGRGRRMKWPPLVQSRVSVWGRMKSAPTKRAQNRERERERKDGKGLWEQVM